jgi:hypothetical protein
LEIFPREFLNIAGGDLLQFQLQAADAIEPIRLALRPDQGA